MKRLFIISLVAMTALSSFGQTRGSHAETIVLGGEIMPKDSTKRIFKNRLIAPKGEWQCGLAVMYANFSTSDYDYMMLLQGLNANASFLRLSPQASYTFANNHAVGLRFNYTTVSGLVDNMTADLLGNFSMSMENIEASTSTVGGAAYQRTYVGLDRYGRVGIFWDYILGYSRARTQFQIGAPSSAYSINRKVHMGFAPGIVYFPMNNISIQASICLADISYNNVRVFSDGNVTGKRNMWKAQARLNLLDLNFGLTIHL